MWELLWKVTKGKQDLKYIVLKSTCSVEQDPRSSQTAMLEQTSTQQEDVAGQSVADREKRQTVITQMRDFLLCNNIFIFQDEAFLDWLGYREEYLLEILRHEGYRDTKSCCGCGENLKTFVSGSATGVSDYYPVKCEDCVGRFPVCAKCAVLRHDGCPTHRLKVRVHLLTNSTAN